MSEAPTFWFKGKGLPALLLAPAAWVYGSVSGRRMVRPAAYVSRLPVICVGNLIAGGAGKTPTALALAELAQGLGYRPGFLSRGHGGSLSKATRVDRDHHNARDTGDEPLLLAARAPTVVSADRVAGVRLLEETGVDLVIMDDGFQNPALQKDFSLVVVDSSRGIGNAMVHPAGPLRAPLKVQLQRASALLVIGDGKGASQVIRAAAKMAKPIVMANLTVPEPARWRGVKVLAYCGIGDPQKFYHSLHAVGAKVLEERSFGDHHVYSDSDCNELIERAGALNAALTTTAKDKARLARMGERQMALHEASHALPVRLAFENRAMAETVIRDAAKNAERRRLSQKA